MPTSSPFEQQLQQQRSTPGQTPAAAGAGMQPATADMANGKGIATQGYIVKELSVTADLIDSFVQDVAKQEPAASLAQQSWIQALIKQSGGKVVFSAEGDGHAMAQHLRCAAGTVCVQPYAESALPVDPATAVLSGWCIHRQRACMLRCSVHRSVHCSSSKQTVAHVCRLLCVLSFLQHWAVWRPSGGYISAAQHLYLMHAH
jgi:hypothetical protein